MKRVVAAFFLLAASVFIALWSGNVFRAELNSLTSSLNRLIDISETASDEILKEETDNVMAEWEKASKILHSLVLHEGMDELEQNVTSLPLIIEHSSREIFRTKCIEAINQIKNLLNSEKLSAENIF